MAKKNVSKHPEFVRRVSEGVRRDMENNAGFHRDETYWDSLPEYSTEEEIRKARNAGKRRMYAVLKAGGSVNYPGGPAKLCEEIESGMYDD